MHNIINIGKLYVHSDDTIWEVSDIYLEYFYEIRVVVKSKNTNSELTLELYELLTNFKNSSDFRIKPPKDGTYWINRNNGIKYKVAEVGDYLMIDLSEEGFGKGRQYTEDCFYLNFSKSILEG